MAAWTIVFHLEHSFVVQYYSCRPVFGDERKFYGSDPILALLTADTDDGCFEKYKTPSFRKLIRRQGASLQEAIEAATNYIEACSQPEAKALDEACGSIGGRIHIATIKPTEGFAWVPKMGPDVKNRSVRGINGDGG